MNLCKMSEAEILHTLRDVKCDDATVQKFMQLRAQQRWADAARLLACHRCHLVCAMHEAQKPIDVLDYLIHQLQKCSSDS